MLIFQVVLPVREPSVATISESLVFTSPKDIVKPGMKVLKVREKCKLFWSHFSVIA